LASKPLKKGPASARPFCVAMTNSLLLLLGRLLSVVDREWPSRP
jgi:hypothetical protein